MFFCEPALQIVCTCSTLLARGPFRYGASGSEIFLKKMLGKNKKCWEKAKMLRINPTFFNVTNMLEKTPKMLEIKIKRNV
jgi:hypothetical protein